MSTEFPDDTSLRIRRSITATAERVWKAFTRPEQMVRWMWAGYQANSTASCDLRIGGRYAVSTDAPDGDFGWDSDRWEFSGIFIEIVPQRRLVYTIHWNAPVGYNQTGAVVLDEVVFVEMSDRDGETEITMWHVGLPADDVSARTHAEGIESMFDHLEALVRS